MDKSDGRESELEQELDQLYRSVAGIDPPEVAHMREETEDNLKTSAEAGTLHMDAPGAQRAPQGKKKSSFRIALLAWGLLCAALTAVFLAFLLPMAFDRHPTTASGLHNDPAAPNRPTGKEAYLKYKDGRHYPIPSDAIVLTIEDAKEPSPTTGSSSANRDSVEAARTHDVNAPRERPSVHYAIQIRAYPEDQEKNAIAFLEDLRKQNPDASLETVSLTERGVWHRILLGDFSSKEAAEDYRERRGIARDYPLSFIQKKSGARLEPKSP